MTKECTKCKQDKQLTEFHKDKRQKDGHVSQCKSCIKQYHANHYKQNREVILKRNADWVQNNPEKSKQRQDKWIKNNPHKQEMKSRKSHLKQTYGITLAEYDTMLTEQKGLCGICGEDNVAYKKKHLCVDHCHKTGKIRGLLCDACNIALGKLRDSKQRLLNAISYLEDSERG